VHVSTVREFYRWLYRGGHVSADLADRVPVPSIGKKLPSVMSLASAEKLMWSPDFSTFEGVRDGAMMALLVGCGFRVSGLVGLNESDIQSRDVDGKPRLALRVREKGDKQRQVPIPPEADLLLRMYLEHPALKEIDRSIGDRGDRVLFVSTANRLVGPHDYRGERRRLTRRSINNILMKYGKQAGIPERELHPHAMRHLFGTELAESNIDILQRQQLMGHADPKSTAIYEHLAFGKATRAIDQGNPLSKVRSPVSDLLKRLAAGNSGPPRDAS
jgi:site-specific recombinase XerD